MEILKKYIFYFYIANFVSIFMVAIILLFVKHEKVPAEDDSDLFHKHLIYNPKCIVPDYESFGNNRPFYIASEYIPCAGRELLTNIIVENGKAFILLQTEILDNMTVSCCYCDVTPDRNDAQDYAIEVSECWNFENKTEIINDVIYVKCYGNHTLIYENVYTTTLLRWKLTNVSSDDVVKKNTRPNVLIIGVSSLSRANFPKVFPQTYYYLKYKNWLDYRIFNRIGDEDNLNLIALLTGDYYIDSNWQENFDLNTKFLWRDFQKLGYVTAYVMDSIDDGVSRNTSSGFKEKPTDFYFRSYIIASHMLQKVFANDSIYCVGPETTVERILNLAKDFATISLKESSFGVFWTDSFHRRNSESLNGLDDKLKDFFQYLHESTVLQNTIVMFLSDQGDEDKKKSLRGWLAQQIPFLFMWIPPPFKEEHPTKFKYIRENANSLTSPFDLYLTIQDILAIYNKGYVPKGSNACPQCHSLLENKYTVRSCKDASIEDNWCSCLGYKKLKFGDSVINHARKFICTSVQRQIARVINGTHTCQVVEPCKIKYAWLTENTNKRKNNYLKLGIETNQSLNLDATLEVNYKNGTMPSFKIVDKIEGIDWDSVAMQCGRNPEDVMEIFIR